MLDEADTLTDDDVDTAEIEAPEAEATPDDGAPIDAAGQAGSADAAGQTGSEQDTPEASEAEPNGNLEKRYKDLQREFTRKSQELAALKKGGVAQAPAPEVAVESDFSEEKFEEIAEKEGRGKALKYMHDCSVKAALKANEQVQAQREAEARKTQEIMGILQEFGDSEEVRQNLAKLGEREVQQGFIPSPAALYALAEANGDHREMIRLVRAGKKALAGADDSASTVKPGAKPPPMPGGSAKRAPNSTAKPAGKVPLSALGFR